VSGLAADGKRGILHESPWRCQNRVHGAGREQIAVTKYPVVFYEVFFKGNEMKYQNTLLISVICMAALLAGCGGNEEPASVPAETAMTAPAENPATPEPAMDEVCASTPGADYLCGVINGEDILRLGNSPWLLVSGLDGSLSGEDIRGRIHLVNASERTVEILFPGSNPMFRQDSERFPGCPGPMDTLNLSSHGLALQASDKGPDIYNLYMTSHGAREAIEVFEIEAFLKPTITWVGCIPMPASSWTNSVAILDDGGFVATQFFNPAEHTIDNVLAGEITGHVFEWHPGESVGTIPGTEAAGPNGIVVSADERHVFVAAFGTSELLKFDRTVAPVTRESVRLDIVPDNVRWTAGGKLLVAGNNTPDYCGQQNCEPGWSVIEVDPETLEAQRIAGLGEDSALHDASSALLVDGEIWVGTYSGDRLAILPRE